MALSRTESVIHGFLCFVCSFSCLINLGTKISPGTQYTIGIYVIPGLMVMSKYLISLLRMYKILLSWKFDWKPIKINQRKSLGSLEFTGFMAYQ